MKKYLVSLRRRRDGSAGMRLRPLPPRKPSPDPEPTRPCGRHRTLPHASGARSGIGAGPASALRRIRRAAGRRRCRNPPARNQTPPSGSCGPDSHGHEGRDTDPGARYGRRAAERHARRPRHPAAVPLARRVGACRRRRHRRLGPGAAWRAPIPCGRSYTAFRGVFSSSAGARKPCGRRSSRRIRTRGSSIRST